MNIGVEEEFKGIVDLFCMKVIYWNEEDQGMIYELGEILDDLVEICNYLCEQMVELVVEVSEELMEKYLEESDLSIDDIKLGLCKQVLNNEIVFVFCGFVFKNKGVQVMLDVVIEFFFVSDEVFSIKGIIEKGEEEVWFFLDDVSFLALVFKIVMDLFVGNLIFFWVYFGVMNLGDLVYNFVRECKECVGWFLQMYVNNCEEIKEVWVGDIVVVVGLKDIMIGDILCDLKSIIVFEWMDFFDFVIFVVVELCFKVDQEKMGFVLGWLV